jgi:hypothetical protein
VDQSLGLIGDERINPMGVCALEPTRVIDSPHSHSKTILFGQRNSFWICEPVMKSNLFGGN